MLELYNTTSDVKRIPKYKYSGKFIIPPHGFVRIEDDQAYFFKPYARVGIVIRKQYKKEEPEKEVKDEVKAEVKTEVKKEEKVENNPSKEVKAEEVKAEKEEVQEDKEPEKEDEVRLEKADSTPVDLHVYTEEELQEKNLQQLRNISSALGIDASSIRKKDEIRSMILEKHGK